MGNISVWLSAVKEIREIKLEYELGQKQTSIIHEREKVLKV